MKTIVVPATLCLALGGSLPPLKAQEPKSPMIEALRRDSAGGTARAWDELVAHGMPVVEPIPVDPGKRLVTFVWRGDSATRNVVVITPLTLMDFEASILERLGATNLWFKSFVLPADSRFLYRFAPNDNLTPFDRDPNFFSRMRTWLPDPINPKRFDYGGFGRLSVLELPDAPSDRWIVPRPEVPHGAVVASTIASRVLGRDVQISIYLPSGFAPTNSHRYPVVTLMDGEDYRTLIPGPTIFDNLTAAERIPPTIGVFIDNPQESRGDDLDCNPKWSRFVATEVMPWIEARYRVVASPSQRVVGGFSLGGLAAACTAIDYPATFGNVLAQSGSFYRGADRAESVAGRLAATPRRALRFALEIGRFEKSAIPSRDPSMYTATLHLYDVLIARGYPASLRVLSSGHEHVAWRATFGEELIELLRPAPRTPSRAKR